MRINHKKNKLINNIILLVDNESNNFLILQNLK